jgi:hypothetical protein
MIMRSTVDAILRNNRNPFITVLSFLSTDELVTLENTLSGGYWLGQVRRELNLRVPAEGDTFDHRLTHHGRNVVFHNSY